MGDRRRAWHRLLLGTLFLGATTLFVWAMSRHVGAIRDHAEGLDFDDYYFTAKSVLKSHNGVYDHGAMAKLARQDRGATGLPVFVYPPLLIVLFLPLAKLSYVAARFWWLFFNQVCLGAGVFGCARIYAARGGRPPSTFFCILSGLLGAAAYDPTLDHDWQGQCNHLISALIVWALYAHMKSKRSDVATAALLAPAILIKLFPAVFLPYLLVRRAWRALLWTAVAGAAITALTLIWVRWADYVAFPRVLLGSTYLQEGVASPGDYSMTSAAWWVGSLVHIRPSVVKVAASLVRYLPYSLVVGAVAWEARRESSLEGLARMIPVLRFSQGFLLFGFLLSKWWEHHLVFLLVPMFFALRLILAEPIRARLAAVLVVTSALFLGCVRHPLLWEHVLNASKWAPLRDHLLEGKRIAILMLGGGIELLIWRLKHHQVPAPSPPVTLVVGPDNDRGLPLPYSPFVGAADDPASLRRCLSASPLRRDVIVRVGLEDGSVFLSPH